MYHLFAGPNYYPIGPIEDYQCSYYDLDEAVAAGEAFVSRDLDAHGYRGFATHDWYSVLYLDKGKLVEAASGCTK